jgi:hypothetical protein
MQRISDSGRFSAPNPAQRRQRDEPPVGKLVVEIWVPERHAPEPPKLRRPAEPRFADSRAVAAFAVVALHASVGACLLMGPVARRLPPTEVPLILLETPAPPGHPARAIVDLPPVDLVRITPTLPKLSSLPHEAPEIALTVSPSTDVLITDANARDVVLLAGECEAGPSRASRSPPHGELLTLLVRVEKDGHVSDSKVEIGSGAARVDEAAQRCLLGRGSLTPRRINGAPVISWQRVHWPAV